MSASADLTAIWVTWRGSGGLDRSVASVRTACARAGLNLEVLVVSNDPHPGRTPVTSVAIANRINAGFGLAMNQGFARSAGDWILTMNSDVRLHPGFFETPEWREGRRDTRAACIVPELRFDRQPDLVNCRGIAVDDTGVPFEVDRGAHISAPLSVRPVGAIGGCALLRADALHVVRGFEPAFFAYGEDVDLALRLARAGYKAVFAPGAIAWHAGSQSTLEGSWSKAYLVARSRRMLFTLNGPFTPRAALWRAVTETVHCAGMCALTRSLAPVIGRLHAARVRRYLTAQRGARERTFPAASVQGLLTPRRSLIRTLIVKLRTARWMASDG